jgi:hypothetical protein
MNSAILGPVVALAAWTMVIWIWMYATRLPAMGRAGIDAKNMVGSSGSGLRNELIAKGEEKASWVADNYNHLHEAPTVFYAVAIVYVGLRVAHSLIQILSNRVIVRFMLFALSTLALMMLVVHAAMTVFLY